MKILDIPNMKEELEKFFKEVLKKGHKCIFTGKKVKLSDIVKDEEQFRLCMLCRLASILVSLSFIGEGLKKIRKDIKGKKEPSEEEETPSYIA